MKKLLTALALGTALTGSAYAANYISASVGTGFTLYYQQDRSDTRALRYGLNLSATGFDFDHLSVGAGVDYLNDFTGRSLGLGLTPYYGYGLDAGVYLGDYSGTVIYPHVLAGLRYNVSTPLSIFGEINAGPAIGIGDDSGGTDFGYGLRLGVNYRLN